MKTIRSFVISTTLLASAAALTFSGCANSSGTSTYTQSEKAAKAILSTGGTLTNLNSQIDATLASVDSLVNQPASNLTAQYQTFVKQFAALEKQANTVSENAKTMRAKADQYLSIWGTQVASIQNTSLRSAALDRRAEVSAQLQKLISDYSNVSSSYAPLQQSLKDIQQVLGADLTPAGLNTVRPFVAQAAQKAQPIKQAVSSLTNEFANLSNSLKPVGTPATTSN